MFTGLLPVGLSPQLTANNYVNDKIVIKIFVIFFIRISSFIKLKLFITKQGLLLDKLSELIEVDNKFVLDLHPICKCTQWARQRRPVGKATLLLIFFVSLFLITRGFNPLRLICNCTQWAKATLLSYFFAFL